MKKVIAYFPNWGTYSAAHHSFSVSMIPWEKITVINHSFYSVVGDVVRYKNKLYKCLQSHTSLVGWEPENVPSLWQLQ